jgi:glycosyltransferase involved in cell wall biosynthesis
MRILYHHRTRAADAQGVHIAEMIRAFSDLGHTVEVASLARSNANSGPSAASHREPLWSRLFARLPIAPEILQLGYNVMGLLIVARAIRRFRPDFIYERYALFNFSGVLAARLFRLPLILEVNSPLAREARDEKRLALYRFAQRVETAICNAATRVIAVSTPLKRILVSHGVRAGRIAVMPNGVSPQLCQPIPADPTLRASLGLRGGIVVGFVGWFRPWHGLDLLIDAFAASRLASEGGTLLLIGDGPAMAALKAKVAQHGLERSTVFTGPLRHRDVAAHVALFDIAVQPAAVEYCCPMKIIEYLAQGKPVIAPRQDNICEILDDGVDALFFAPRDAASMTAALDRAAGDPELCRSLREAARGAISRRGLLWSNNAAAVIAMVEQALTSQGTPRPRAQN